MNLEERAEIKKDGTIPQPRLSFKRRSDREFRTQFINASKEPPNFAGHYRVATGLGTDCLEGGIVDLSTGQLMPFAPLKELAGEVGTVRFCNWW